MLRSRWVHRGGEQYVVRMWVVWQDIMHRGVRAMHKNEEFSGAPKDGSTKQRYCGEPVYSGCSQQMKLDFSGRWRAWQGISRFLSHDRHRDPGSRHASPSQVWMLIAVSYNRGRSYVLRIHV